MDAPSSFSSSRGEAAAAYGRPLSARVRGRSAILFSFFPTRLASEDATSLEGERRRILPFSRRKEQSEGCPSPQPYSGAKGGRCF